MTWSRGHRPSISLGAVFGYSLQLQDDTFWQAGNNTVTVVQSTDDECMDKLFQHLLVDVYVVYN